MASLFDAAHSGDVAAVRARAAEGIDINAKDVNGRSALILAIEGGHDDVVSELLARGADRHEALAAGHGQSGSNIATLLNDAQLRSQHGAEGEHQQQQHQQPPHHPMFGPIPTDIYGGYQLPDGSIAYGGYPQYPPPFQGGAPGQPTFYHDPVMFPHSGASMPPYPFPLMAGGGGPRPRGSSSFGQASQGRKPSTVGKLPPPEIAKTIPCRFYPNCRNGASCIFAHVDGNVMPDASPSVTSPSHPPHHPHDGGAPPPPPGYYGLPPFPPHFYMMPHGNGANGAGPMAAMPFSGPSGAPMPLHYQPHEAPHPGQMTPVAPVAEDALPTAAAPAAPESEQVAAADEASAQQSAPAPAPQEEGKGGPAEEAATDAAGDDLDRRRRQSFNSFLHSHAVPFQPAHVASSVNGAAVPIPLGPAAASMHGYGHGQGGFNGRGKLRGRGGGAAGMMGRGKHERSPCTFFARNACKYGSECLFPHILPDGSDARRLPGTLQPRHGQQIQHVDGAGPSSSVAPVNGDAPPKTGNTPRQPAAASVPLGPKLKREAGLPPTPSVEVTSSAAQAQESGASKDSKKVQAQAQSQSNGVVPSKPSATALAGAAAAAAAATSVPATSSSSSSSQAQPQGQSQQQPSQPQQQQQQPARKPNAAKANGVQNNKKAPIAPAQRMPSGADFPALPGSPNTSAGFASQNPPSPAVSTPAQPSQQASSPEASNAAPASTSAPPKVNFSAILSAPAPPKKAVIAAPTTTTTTESSPAATPAETNGDVEVTDKVDEQTSSSAAPAKEKASSGKPNKQNSAASGGKAWGQQRPQHHNSHQQQPLASSKEPILDADDFQLVKGRNHGKRATGSSRSGGASSSFAAATKAAVTA